MRVLILSVLLLAALVSAAVAQNSPSPSDPAITHGPVVEGTTDTTAVIAWTTNVNSGTLVKYGFDPAHLDSSAEMPWGGITHRVHIKGLKPATTYYFQALSPQAQDSGTTVESPVGSFTTQAALNTTQPR